MEDKPVSPKVKNNKYWSRPLFWWSAERLPTNCPCFAGLLVLGVAPCPPHWRILGWGWRFMPGSAGFSPTATTLRSATAYVHGANRLPPLANTVSRAHIGTAGRLPAYGDAVSGLPIHFHRQLGAFVCPVPGYYGAGLRRPSIALRIRQRHPYAAPSLPNGAWCLSAF